MRLRFSPLGIVALLAGCGSVGARPPGLIRLEVTRRHDSIVLTLLAAPGAKISAKLKPDLELKSGQHLIFDSPAVTEDSAYFTEPPTSLLLSRADRVEGSLQAGVCPRGLAVCQSVTLSVSERVGAP